VKDAKLVPIHFSTPFCLRNFARRPVVAAASRCYGIFPRQALRATGDEKRVPV
jgi:hypothetical protein